MLGSLSQSRRTGIFTQHNTTERVVFSYDVLQMSNTTAVLNSLNDTGQ